MQNVIDAISRAKNDVDNLKKKIREDNDSLSKKGKPNKIHLLPSTLLVVVHLFVDCTVVAMLCPCLQWTHTI
jgi:hypothetical protein